MPAIIVDALWGDSGKGKIAAYLAQKHQTAFSVQPVVALALHALISSYENHDGRNPTPTYSHLRQTSLAN